MERHYTTSLIKYDIPDPELSKLGQQQCRDLSKHLHDKVPIAQKIETIITSPMIRTVETTLLGLDWLIQRGVPVETDALWQENSSKPCDTGSPTSHLSTLFPSIDFSHVDPTYPAKDRSTPYYFSRETTIARGQTCLKNLHAREEKVIAVVSHSGFLRLAVSQCKYANADFRIFEFADAKAEGGELRLEEWEETEKSGGGMGKSEKGKIEVSDRDFPAEQAEEVKKQMGEKSSGEAAKEVPS